MQREILTNDKIKRDIKYVYATKQPIGYSYNTGISGAILSFLLITGLYALSFTFPVNDVFGAFLNKIIAVVYIVVLVAAMVFSLRHYIIYYRIKKNKFVVKQERLVNTKEGTVSVHSTAPYYTRGEYRRLNNKPYILQFEKSGIFKIPKIEKLLSDSGNITSYKEMFSTAEIGDTYYLVMLGKKIVFVYNTRFFDYLK